MRLVLAGNVVRIGLSKELHEVLNDIYYVDIKRTPIIKFAKIFFRALRLFSKVRDDELWLFLYSPEVQKRMYDAFSRANEIDGELMQTELNKRQELAQDYIWFNKVYQKLVQPIPEEYIKRLRRRKASSQNKHLDHLKQIKNNLN